MVLCLWVMIILLFWGHLFCQLIKVFCLKCFGIINPYSIYSLSGSTFRDPCGEGKAAGHHFGCAWQFVGQLQLQLVHLQKAKMRGWNPWWWLLRCSCSLTYHLRDSEDNNIGVLSKTDLVKVQQWGYNYEKQNNFVHMYFCCTYKELLTFHKSQIWKEVE